MQWLLIVAQSLVKDLQENPLKLYLTFLSKFIIVIVLDSMHISIKIRTLFPNGTLGNFT